MSVEDYDLLTEVGVIAGPIELIDGKLVWGKYAVFLSPAQARAAAALGVIVPTYVDAILADPEALAELRERLGK